MKTRVPTAARCAMLLSSLLFPTRLHAQERIPEDSVKAIPLAPVTVTVLRTPIRPDVAPYSVGVREYGEEDRARPRLGLDEALRSVAGVQVDNRYNHALGERISVRGFGARSQFGVRGVRVIVDGIPATLPDGQTQLNHVDPGELGRAEVIRGPASALWGNAAGGVIQLETEATPTAPFRQELEAVAGADGMLRLSSTTSGRSGAASYRIAVSRFSTEGHRDWSAADNLRANARLGYVRGADEFRLVGNVVHYDARNPGSLSAAQLVEDRTQAHDRNRLQQTGEEAVQGQLGMLWTRALEDGALEVSVFGTAKRLENPIPNTIIDVDRVSGGARVLLRRRVRVGGRELHWAIGAESELQRDDRMNRENVAGEAGDLTLDQLEWVSGGGVFAQVAVPITSRLQALTSLRYDRIRFEADDRLVDASNPDDSGSRTMDALSPGIGVTLELAGWACLYGNLATAFETPTTTELANRPTGAGGFNPELEPQRTRSYEAGAKGRIGSVDYQLAVYRARVEGALIPFEVSDAPGRHFFRNAGSALHRGAEASASFQVLGRLAGQVAYTYTDARFESYAEGGEVYDGRRVPGVAPFRFDATLVYRDPAGWFVGVDHRRLSRIPVNDANDAYSPAYHVTDVRAGVVALRIGEVEVAPFIGVTNLFDARYNASVTVNAFGQRYFEPAPGRALYAGASFAFGGR